MSKTIVIALLAIVVVAAYLTVREEGVESAFGGLFAPIEPVRAADDSRATPLAGLATGNSIPQTSGTNYKRLVDRVRTKVNGAMDRSVERSSR